MINQVFILSFCLSSLVDTHFCLVQIIERGVFWLDVAFVAGHVTRGSLCIYCFRADVTLRWCMSCAHFRKNDWNLNIPVTFKSGLLISEMEFQPHRETHRGSSCLQRLKVPKYCVFAQSIMCFLILAVFLRQMSRGARHLCVLIRYPIRGCMGLFLFFFHAYTQG